MTTISTFVCVGCDTEIRQTNAGPPPPDTLKGLCFMCSWLLEHGGDSDQREALRRRLEAIDDDVRRHSPPEGEQ
jgi:hypothetical protein